VRGEDVHCQGDAEGGADGVIPLHTKIIKLPIQNRNYSKQFFIFLQDFEVEVYEDDDDGNVNKLHNSNLQKLPFSFVILRVVLF